MELVIRVDVEKAQLSLPEIFKLVGECRFTEEVKDEDVGGAVTVVRNGKAVAVGRWEVEEAEEAASPLDSSYRSAATARYAQPNRIEVDRFATVSVADDGAYVQGWLHVPRADVANSGDAGVGKKPPVSVRTVGQRVSKSG